MWPALRARMGTKSFAVAAASAVSLATGSAAGYLVATKKLETKYAEIANKEILEAKKYYTVLPEKPDPEDLAKQYAEEEPADEEMEAALAALKQYTGQAMVPDDNPAVSEFIKEEVEQAVTASIFDREDAYFDYEVEVSKRGEVDPFIITKEEFYHNEPENVQVEITYYEADDIVSDGKDLPVEDVDGTVGREALQRFGAGSGDRNVVYVRNPRMQTDFEIVCSKGSYAEEVHGIIRHDDRRRPRKFRVNED